MRIIVASSNRGKIEEIKNLMDEFEVLSYGEVMDEFEIEESGSTFQENALIKSRAIFQKLGDDTLVISDDSGISVPAFEYEPGIYSARYAGVGANMSANLKKLIDKMKDQNIKRTNAFYSASIAISSKELEYTVHGWMYGDIIDELRGDNGFGYDPMFIPRGFEKTLGELPFDIKRGLSHRSKALDLAKNILNMFAQKSFLPIL